MAGGRGRRTPDRPLTFAARNATTPKARRNAPGFSRLPVTAITMEAVRRLTMPERPGCDRSMRQKVPEPFHCRLDITLTGLFRLPVLRQHRLATCSPGDVAVAVISARTNAPARAGSLSRYEAQAWCAEIRRQVRGFLNSVFKRSGYRFA
jgi:hypothetical protein